MLDIKKLKALTPHFGKTPSLYTYKEFENLINLRSFLVDKRLTPAQDHKRYEWLTPEWHTQVNCWPLSAIKQILKYSAIYIRDCARASRKINGFSEKLESVFKEPVDCHIYFSNNSKVSKSFGKHKDKNHNVIVICEGKVNFKIYDGNKIMNKNLTKGDYAFVPAGVYHKVEPLTNKRLSCSFPVDLTMTSHSKVFEEREWLTI